MLQHKYESTVLLKKEYVGFSYYCRNKITKDEKNYCFNNDDNDGK